MAFGWPTRLLSLDTLPQQAQQHDAAVYALARAYERGGNYDFFCWNCHSFVAALLNRLHWEHDHPLARVGRGWTVVAVGALFLLRSRHVSLAGWLQTWGGFGCIWTWAIYASLRSATIGPLRSWCAPPAAPTHLGERVLSHGLAGAAAAPHLPPTRLPLIVCCGRCTVQLGVLVFFLLWFGVLAACGLPSQKGELDQADADDDEREQRTLASVPERRDQ
jgi:hypothetical protein